MGCPAGTCPDQRLAEPGKVATLGRDPVGDVVPESSRTAPGSDGCGPT